MNPLRIAPVPTIAALAFAGLPGCTGADTPAEVAPVVAAAAAPATSQPVPIPTSGRPAGPVATATPNAQRPTAAAAAPTSPAAFTYTADERAEIEARDREVDSAERGPNYKVGNGKTRSR